MNNLDPTQIILGVLTLVGAIYSARAQRSAKAAHAEVVTNHGRRHGDYIEAIARDVAWLRVALVEHLRDHSLGWTPQRGRLSRSAEDDLGGPRNSVTAPWNGVPNL